MSIEVNKVIRDGKVAVLVSPGYGAGWSTWASSNEKFALFDSRLVDWVEGGKVGDIDELVKSILMTTTSIQAEVVTWKSSGYQLARCSALTITTAQSRLKSTLPTYSTSHKELT